MNLIWVKKMIDFKVGDQVKNRVSGEYGFVTDLSLSSTYIYVDGDKWYKAHWEVVQAPVQEDPWDTSVRGSKMSNTKGRTIFKYQMPVLESFTMKLPKGAEILRVTDQDGMFWLWALVDTEVADEERHFKAYKCGGGPIPADAKLKYIGFCAIFVQMELGLYIFEETK